MGLSHDDLRRKSDPGSKYYGSGTGSGTMAPNSESSRPGISEIWNTIDSYKIRLHAPCFSLKDLTVRTVDNYLVIEGHHDEQEDEHGLVSREFARIYIVPQDVDLKTFTASFDEDGVLTIEAPKKKLLLPDKESVSVNVPIVTAPKPQH